MSESPVVRPCSPHDLEALNDLYNHFVRTSHATFDLEEIDLRRRREWYAHHLTQRHRVLVAVGGSGLLGFASSGRYRGRAGYDTSVETGCYGRPESQGEGVGRRLYGRLLADLEGAGVHRALAGIAQPNPASVALHLAMGFRSVGRFTEQGRKFGRYWDVAWYERPLALSESPSQRSKEGGRPPLK